MNAYGLSSVVFNVASINGIYILNYSIIDPCSIMLKVPLKESSQSVAWPALI